MVGVLSPPPKLVKPVPTVVRGPVLDLAKVVPPPVVHKCVAVGAREPALADAGKRLEIAPVSPKPGSTAARETEKAKPEGQAATAVDMARDLLEGLRRLGTAHPTQQQPYLCAAARQEKFRGDTKSNSRA